MPRALWKGAITFGLVNIPVELYSAEERKEFKFSMLDKRDFSPVGYKRYSKESGKDVEWADIVKGYEYEKGQYVVLSEEDFRRANVKASQTIDIQAFVPDGEIPYEYFETPYYTAPSGRGAKVYALLRETLKATKRIAVAQVVIRTTQHLAVVVPSGNMLLMNTLRYPNELKDTKDLDLPADGLKAAGVTPKEVELAKRLIEDMSEHWKPSEFHNTYHEDLMARIEQKIKEGETHEITKPEAETTEERPTAKVIDLAELLKQSLGKADKGNGRKKARDEAANETEAEETKAAKKPATRRKAASSAEPIRMKSAKPPLHMVAKKAPAKRKRA
jgi:DNA end-binding protein Ku